MGVKYRKEIICLANSRKLSGKCVAGKEVDAPHRWIRPVGATPTGELSASDMAFKDARVLRPLDVIHVCMLNPKPQMHQTENHLIDPVFYWTYKRRAQFSELQNMIDTAQGTLWHNNQESYHGRHDRVYQDLLPGISSSLKLVKVEDLHIRVLAEQEKYGNNDLKVRGFFTWGGTTYALLVTDPIFAAKFSAKGAGNYELGDALLCLSLGEVYTDGYAYKLIAGVVLPP